MSEIDTRRNRNVNNSVIKATISHANATIGSISGANISVIGNDNDVSLQSIKKENMDPLYISSDDSDDEAEIDSSENEAKARHQTQKQKRKQQKQNCEHSKKITNNDSNMSGLGSSRCNCRRSIMNTVDTVESKEENIVFSIDCDDWKEADLNETDAVCTNAAQTAVMNHEGKCLLKDIKETIRKFKPFANWSVCFVCFVLKDFELGRSDKECTGFRNLRWDQINKIGIDTTICAIFSFWSEYRHNLFICVAYNSTFCKKADLKVLLTTHIPDVACQCGMKLIFKKFPINFKIHGVDFNVQTGIESDDLAQSKTILIETLEKQMKERNDILTDICDLLEIKQIQKLKKICKEVKSNKCNLNGEKSDYLIEDIEIDPNWVKELKNENWMQYLKNCCAKTFLQHANMFLRFLDIHFALYQNGCIWFNSVENPTKFRKQMCFHEYIRYDTNVCSNEKVVRHGQLLQLEGFLDLPPNIPYYKHSRYEGKSEKEVIEIGYKTRFKDGWFVWRVIQPKSKLSDAKATILINSSEIWKHCIAVLECFRKNSKNGVFEMTDIHIGREKS